MGRQLSYEELQAKCDRLEEERNKRLQGELLISDARTRVDEELTRFKAIQEFTTEALEMQSVDDLMELFLDAAIEALECETAYFCEFEEGASTLDILQEFGEEPEVMTIPCTPALPSDQDATLLEEGNPMLYEWSKLGLYNAMIATFERKDNPKKGLIIVGTTTENANVFKKFDQSHTSSLSVLVSQLGSIWNNLILYQEIRDYSIELEKQQKALERTNESFSRFVPNDFLEFLDKKSIVDVQLGDNVQKTMSVLFSDIRSFTTISEGMSPEETFNFVNNFLKHMSPVIRKHNGFIDKYIGDAIMALFPTDPDDAILAAIAMREELNVFNKERVRQGTAAIEFGIGIHTGTLMLGTIGEEMRMEGTVISDAVNLAARIEGLTKHFGAGVLVSQITLDGLNNSQIGLHRFVGNIKVKGKDQGVSIYDVFEGDASSQKQLKTETVELFQLGLQLYFNKSFTEAREVFLKVSTINPGDLAAKMYVDLCSHLIESGTKTDWDGSIEMDQK